MSSIPLLELLQIETIHYDNENVVPLEDSHLKEMSKMTSLQSIYIKTNNITEIPSEFGNLIKLKSLEIDVNKLQKIHPDISRLTNLEEVRLPSNKKSQTPLIGSKSE